MFGPAVSDMWWKNAVVYCLDVETFLDADGNGVGDFLGLTQRIPYLDALGVSCIWLLPFQPTGGQDDGYDVTDYYAVDPRLGTLGTFVEFTRTAHERGIRVVADLVVNHTSTEHPWFRSARSSRHSPYRDWYVWSDEVPEQEKDLVFPGEETSNWEWHEESGQYYLHRFYSSQADLNVANPAVREEIHRIMGFWLQLGVSGFRVDAAPYLIGPTGIADRMPQDPHVFLRDMHAFLSRRRGDAVLLGEVNLGPEERTRYFGDAGDEMTGLFDFLMSGALFASLAREDASALADRLRQTPVPPDGSQWLQFVRNHDELNLAEAPEDQKRDVMAAFAPEERMRIYGRGIRRRLPPMVGGDRRRLELAYSLLLTLPGTPVLLYGEEIGMGDDLDAEGRHSVRAPMQWSDRECAGFTSNARDITRAVISGGEFGFERVNVAQQRRDPDSLLQRVQRAISVRKECPEFGWGSWSVLGTGDDRVLAHRCDWLEGVMLAVHNLCGEEITVRLDLPRAGEFSDVIDVFGDRAHTVLDLTDPRTTMPPYGYRWLRLRRRGSRTPL